MNGAGRVSVASALMALAGCAWQHPTPQPQPSHSEGIALAGSAPVLAASPLPSPSALPSLEGLNAHESYTQVIRPLIFQKSCMPCHSTENHKGDTVLDTFEGATDSADDIRDAVFDSLSMPPSDSGLDPLSEEDGVLLKSWLDLVTLR